MKYSAEKFKVFLRTSVLPAWMFRLRAAIQKIPDASLYSPTFHPWRDRAFRASYDEIASRTLLTCESAWTLSTLVRQALLVEGDLLEAGVYRGGTARLIRNVLRSSPDQSSGHSRHLHLFDTFEGMPKVDVVRDMHRPRDFLDTSLESVLAFVGTDEWIHYHKGLIPEIFANLGDLRLAFAHVDVDIYRSVLDCCEFIYPRLSSGGILLFDDYGAPSCPGARAAVERFFCGRPEVLLVLHTGQAIVFRH
jgi:O-methyltransferase